jgi:zinc protease
MEAAMRRAGLVRGVLCATLAALSARAEESAAIRREVLPNGAVLVVREDHNMPVVTLQAWFPVGSTTEGENLGRGLSHFVEHMIFKGTATQKPGDYARAVRAAGGTLNAYTAFERTVFFCTVRSEFFDSTLASFSDVIMNSSMDAAEAEKEQQVIVNELRAYLDDPGRLIQYAYNETAWRVHPARHPVGGYLEEFLRLKPSDVGEYFRRWYAPNNMVFIVVGDIDGARAIAAVRKAFQGWERKALPPIVLPEEPEQFAARREVRTYPVTGPSGGARIKIGWPGVSCRHADAPALDMAALVLGLGDSSRLARSLKMEKRLAQGTFARNDTPGYAGHFSVGATLDPARLEDVEKELIAQVEKLKADGVTEEELERVRASLESLRVTNLQTVDEQADQIGQSELYYGCPDYLLTAYDRRLKAVTPADIQRVARAWLLPARTTVAIVVPRRAEAEPVPPDGTGAASSFDPRIEEFTLSNGIRVVLRRNAVIPAFGMTVAFLGGSRVEPQDMPGAANLAAEMLMRGTRTRSAARLNDDIGRTGGTLRVQGGRNTLMLHAEMLNRHFDSAAALCADLIMNPAFEPAELDAVRARARFEIERLSRDANGAASTRFHKLIFPGHPYSRLPVGTLEGVAAATPEALRAFHDSITQPANCVVAVVGDVTPEQARATLEKHLGALKARGEAPAVPGVPASIEEAVKDEVSDPSKNMGTVYFGFSTVGMEHEDRWPLLLLDNILGGMGGRLWDQVRDRHNLAYNVWATSVTMQLRGYFQVGVVAQGPNVDRAIEVVLEVLREASEGGITEQEVADARNKAVGESLIALQKNAAQAQAIALDTLYGLGPRRVFEAPQKIGKVTLEDVRRVARHYLNEKRMVFVVTRPGAK